MALSTAATAAFEAIVVGAGPAGLAAALTLGRMRIRTVVFDSNQYRNSAVHEMHTVVTRDGEDPATFRQIGRDQLAKYDTVEIRRGRTVVEARRAKVKVVDVVSGELADYENGFVVVDQDGAETAGQKIVLATGTEDVLPTDIEGYAENWPNHIFPCLFCDGFEAYSSNKPVGILTSGTLRPELAHLIFMARRLTTSTTTIFTNGEPIGDSEASQGVYKLGQAVGIKFETRKIVRFVNCGPGPANGMDIELGKGGGEDKEVDETVHVAFLTHMTKMVNRSDRLIDMLGLERQDTPGKEVAMMDPMGGTSVPGCFVAGDLAQARAKQVMVATANGLMAGSGVVFQLGAEAKDRFAAAAGLS